MFTGIVSSLGTVVGVTEKDHGRVLHVEDPATATGLSVGDSVAVNGVCLTAVASEGDRFTVEVVGETLQRSNLGSLVEGDRVNLERPLEVSARLDGHIVQGHVDATGVVRSVEPEGDASRLWVDLPAGLMRYVVEKGSVAVDGVSLTVSAVDDEGFEVALIPHTLAVTTFGSRSPGDRLNIEVDVIAKHVERLVEAYR